MNIILIENFSIFSEINIFSPLNDPLSANRVTNFIDVLGLTKEIANSIYTSKYTDKN